MGIGTKKQSVKKQAGKDSQKTSKAVPVDDGIVVGGASKSWYSRIPAFSRLSGRAKVALAAIVLLVCILVVALVLHQNTAKNVGKRLPTPEQYASDTLKKLESTPPAETTSPEGQVDYYRRLSYAYAAVENYKAAIDALNRAVVTAPQSVEYDDYMSLARYYHAEGDNKRALVVLNTAIDVMPQTENETTGYNPVLAKESIDLLRTEYSK